MPITIKKLPNSEVLITVEIGAEKAKEFFDMATSELAKSLELKGFRKGKVPKSIAEKHLSQKDILEKGAEIAVRRTYPDIVLNQKIEAIGAPRVNIVKIAMGSQLVYEVKVAVLPEVKISDYTKIKVERKPVLVEESEVTSAIRWLQKSRAKYKAVNRVARKGDRVEVDFTSRLAGVEVEGGSARSHAFILGEGGLVEGFGDNVVGMKAGEKKNFTVLFPENYQQKNFAGKPIDFEATLKSLQEIELPAIDDEFAKRLGNFASVEELKKSIEEGLMREKGLRETQRLRGEILEKLVEKTEVELPDILCSKELDKMTEELRASIESSGMKFEDYLRDAIKKDISELRKGWQDLAEKRVKSALILREIANRENIEVSDGEVEEKINRDMLSKYKSLKEAHSIYSGQAKREIDLDALKEYTKSAIRNEKTLDWLEQKCVIG